MSTFTKTLSSVSNPFGAPVYHEETVSSTMDAARILAARGEIHGTVITADFQESGRGRTAGSPWNADRGGNLFFTILLRYENYEAIPKAITLRTGLAVSLAIGDFAPDLADGLEVKWPNDVMVDSRKAGGILTESDGKTVFIGVGVNVAQREFPEAIRAKAGSLALALEARGVPVLGPGDLQHPVERYGENRFRLLALILARLYREIGAVPPEASAGDLLGILPEASSGVSEGTWQERLEKRLYRRGQTVRFSAGGADRGSPVEGVLRGIGPEGELLIVPAGETESRAFITGELDVYPVSAKAP
jgi:BirA family biotin operon repressor/biotin-[acetyl-CoA-carboxylase] ligase